MARLRWFGAGAVSGAIGAMWLRRRATRVGSELARLLSPSGLVERAVGFGTERLDAAARRVRDALIEGRVEARRREAELRGALAPSEGDGAQARVGWAGKQLPGKHLPGEDRARAMAATR